MAAHFEPVVDANCRLVAPPPTRRTAIGGYPKVASYDMLCEQLHYSNPVKHGDQELVHVILNITEGLVVAAKDIHNEVEAFAYFIDEDMLK